MKLWSLRSREAVFGGVLSLSDQHSPPVIRVKVIIRPLAASTQISDSECVAEPRYDDPARSQRNARHARRPRLAGCALLATGTLPARAKGRTHQSSAKISALPGDLGPPFFSLLPFEPCGGPYDVRAALIYLSVHRSTLHACAYAHHARLRWPPWWRMRRLNAGERLKRGERIVRKRRIRRRS